MSSNNNTIITDTSVLINFLNIDRIDLLAKYPKRIFITEHVLTEVTHKHLQQKLKAALESNLLFIIDVNQPEEIMLFTQLYESGRLGAGECSAIACAIHRNYTLAIDDMRARKQAKKLDKNLKIITTPDIMIQLIKQDNLTIDEADHIKHEWQDNHKFLLKIESFRELMISETSNEQYF